MDFKKYLVILVVLVIGIFIGKVLPSDSGIDNSARSIFSKPSEESLLKNQAIKLMSSSIRDLPMISTSNMLDQGGFLVMDDLKKQKLDAYEKTLLGPLPPPGSNERPIYCVRIEGGDGPSSFHGNYNGSASGNFNSLMIGNGWQSLYSCRPDW